MDVEGLVLVVVLVGVGVGLGVVVEVVDGIDDVVGVEVDEVDGVDVSVEVDDLVSLIDVEVGGSVELVVDGVVGISVVGGGVKRSGSLAMAARMSLDMEIVRSILLYSGPLASGLPRQALQWPGRG